MSIYYIHPSQSFFSFSQTSPLIKPETSLISKNGTIVTIKSINPITLDCVELKPNRSSILYFPISANLYIKSSGIKNYEYNKEVYVNYSEISKNYICNKFKLFRTVIPFSTKDYFIPPYLVGVWVVKGNRTFIQCNNPLVYNRIQLECKKVEGLECNVSIFKYESVTYTHRFNKVFYDWYKQKTINTIKPSFPEEYLTGDKTQRTEFLEGILDSIGYLKQQSNTFDITLRDKSLVSYIQKLVTSLGFYISITQRKNKCTSQDKILYRLYISVDPNEINCANPSKSYKRSPFPLHSLKSGFKIVSEIKKETFYAVTFDQDPVYLFSDDGLALGIKN